MKWWGPVLAGLLLASCTGVSQASDAQGFHRIALDTNSWGRVITGWSISGTGQGSWWVRENTGEGPARSPVGPYTITRHEFDAGPQGFAQLAAILSGLPDPAPLAADCELFRTDDLYGSLDLTSGATTREISWNKGCRDAAYAAFMEQLEAADELVAQWGRAAPIDRIEHFDAAGKGR